MAKEVAELKEEAQIFKQGHLRSETLVTKAFHLICLHKIIFVLEKFILRLFSTAAIVHSQCLLVLEIREFLHLRTCSPPHLVPLSLWLHNCQKQRSVNGPSVVGEDGIKFDLLLRQRML